MEQSSAYYTERNAAMRQAVRWGKSYAEVGRQFGISRERVRQIVQRPMPPLRGGPRHRRRKPFARWSDDMATLAAYRVRELIHIHGDVESALDALGRHRYESYLDEYVFDSDSAPSDAEVGALLLMLWRGASMPMGVSLFR